MLLCITIDNQHYNAIQHLDQNSIKLNSNSIKEKWMKIGGEGIENLLMNMVFEKKKTLKTHIY